ncbi:MAG: LytTR family DNA-binding domain-containing protein [Pseudomonadota bacterium]
MFSAFIVDDEAMARGNLVDALRHHPRWSTSQTFASGKNLLEDVTQQAPAVVFLDIQMPGEDGIAIAKQLLQLRDAPLIVFVTAFSEHAVAAFELYAVDYLLKPFSDARLAQCIAKLEHALDHPASYQHAQLAQTAWAKAKPLERLVIKSSASVRIIDVERIHRIGANGNYVDIYHEDGMHLLRASLKQVLSSLPEGEFIQVHRSYAVRHRMISEIKHSDNERSVAVMINGDTVPVGKSFRQMLMAAVCA